MGFPFIRTLAKMALSLPALLWLASSPAHGDVAPADAPGSDAAVPPATAIEEVVVTAPEPRFVAPTTRDRIGRIWAPVLINGKGPYRLVLDTGASRSAITRHVADELALPIKPDSVTLRGVTGSTVASTARIDTLQFGELMVEDSRVPIVADAFGGAQGVLGGEGLKDKRILIEFRKDRISIMRSHRVPAPAGFSVVPFKYSPYRGMRANVLVGRVKAVAMIDTGAQMTVGNLALRQALARRAGERDQFDVEIIGVTEDIQKAAPVRIPSIVAGELIVRNAEIVFSDLHIFDHWHIQKQPALLIGMDVLGVLDTLIIDYRRSELQIRTQR
jgi:predicted aspartyl protease